VHQVGAGVLGPVFRGYDPEHDRAVAIKAFALDLTPERAREAAGELGRLPALGLSHPSILAALDAGADGSTAYLVQEYFVAESADVALKQYGPAPVPDAMRLIGQLAGALDLAAAADVHHGSMHPRDILVAPHEVRLTGLGVAAALERVGFHPPVRRPYAAPERVAGEKVTGAADVFSLACVAFELVTGRRPTLSGDSVTADTAAIEAADSDALAEVFARALAPRPEDRHPSALAFAAALKHALTGEPLQVGADTDRPRPRRAAKGAQQAPPLPLEPERAAPVAEVTPGSTPLPSFLESYRPATAGPPDPVPELETGERASISEAEPDLSAFDRRTEATMALPPVAPDVIEERPDFPIPEPLPLHLDDLDLAAHVAERAPAPLGPEPDAPRAEAPAPSSTVPPPMPTESKRRPAFVSLIGMLLVGILIGFPAGYLVATRGQPASPVVPPATPPVEAPVQPAAPPVTAPAIPAGAAAAPGDKPERPPARPRTGRDATATAAGATGAPAAGRKASPAPKAGVFEGTLVIASKPAGASVMLDGRAVGTTPLTLPGIAAGSHVVRLERAGYSVWSSAVQVTTGQQKKVTASLEPRSGGRSMEP